MSDQISFSLDEKVLIKAYKDISNYQTKRTRPLKVKITVRAYPINIITLFIICTFFTKITEGNVVLKLVCC